MPITSQVFRALGDRTRLSVFELLLERPHRVNELVARLSIAQPYVSRHLQVLKSAGLVTDHRSGRTVEYRVAAGDQAAPSALWSWLARASLLAGAGGTPAPARSRAAAAAARRTNSWDETRADGDDESEAGEFVVRKTGDSFDSYLL